MSTNLPNRTSTTDYRSLGGNGIKVIVPADGVVDLAFFKFVPVAGAAVIHSITPSDGYSYDTALNGLTLAEGTEWPVNGVSIRVTSGKVVIFLS